MDANKSISQPSIPLILLHLLYAKDWRRPIPLTSCERHFCSNLGATSQDFYDQQGCSSAWQQSVSILLAQWSQSECLSECSCCRELDNGIHGIIEPENPNDSFYPLVNDGLSLVLTFFMSHQSVWLSGRISIRILWTPKSRLTGQSAGQLTFHCAIFVSWKYRRPPCLMVPKGWFHPLHHGFCLKNNEKS